MRRLIAFLLFAALLFATASVSWGSKGDRDRERESPGAHDKQKAGATTVKSAPDLGDDNVFSSVTWE